MRPNHPCPHMAYRPYDIVSVLPDEQPVGTKQVLPVWAIVDLPGVPVEKLLPFVVSQTEGSNPEDAIVTRRLRRLGKDRIPVSLRNKIEKEGYLELTPAQIDFVLDYLENKVTGQTAREEGFTL